MEIIFDVNKFIEKIEGQLIRYKTTGQKYLYAFDLQFENKTIAENAKIYFESKGYNVDLKWCKACLGTSNKCDIIIEILG